MASTQAEIQVQINWNNYIELVAIVIPYYDFLLTFGDEVELFWQYPSRSFVTILFYVNRYLALLGNVPILYFRFLPKQAKGCQGIVLYNQFFMSIIQLITSTFFVVRVYAIYERNKKILAILILAITAMVVNALVQISSTQISKADTMDYAVGCSQRYSEDQGHHLAYAWLGAALVDLLVFILTFKRTVKLKKIYKRTGLWDLVMRDGIIYFAVITIFNSSNILVFVVTKEYMKPLLSNLSNNIASVMMGRLVLNLRSISQDLDATHITVDSMPLPLSFTPNVTGMETFGQNTENVRADL